MAELKLELGCGKHPVEGYVHHDRIKHDDHVDLAWDLRRRPWPFVLDEHGVIVIDAPANRLPASLLLHPFEYLLHSSSTSPRDSLREATAKIEEWAKAASPLSTSPPVEGTVVEPHGGFLDEILALDVFEHIDGGDLAPCLDESWRLLKPGGRLDIRLPAWDHAATYRDPTHIRGYHQETMSYWDCDDTLWKDFGSVYYAESARWWKVESVRRDNHDFRYVLTKRG
jgi:hypothetical protein